MFDRDGLKRCPKCLVRKPAQGFAMDKSKSGGYSSRCLECRKNYNHKYYDANAEQIMGKRPDLPRISSEKITVKFEPNEMRVVIEACEKLNGSYPTPEQLTEFLMRYAKAGVLGQAKYILQKDEKR